MTKEQLDRANAIQQAITCLKQTKLPQTDFKEVILKTKEQSYYYTDLLAANDSAMYQEDILDAKLVYIDAINFAIDSQIKRLQTEFKEL